MIVKVAKIKFEKFLGIGHNLGFNIKKYLNGNTGHKYMDGMINNIIYEFRFIDGRRYIYKEIYSKSNLNDKINKLIDRINPIKKFIDLIILSIEKE